MSRVNESYLGNQNLKRSNVKHTWSPHEVQEWMRCAEDPEYFIEKYIKIVNVDRGLINFKLYEYQKDIVCRYNPSFDIEKHWNELTIYQKNYVCHYNSNLNFEKHWNELTDYQKDNVCQNPCFDTEKHWNELTDKQKDIIKKRIVIKK